ncbi:hypothetical protein CLOM_g6000 [Closterium sp. NIES-68]|nr:hypothetical protein CLOM_g6000 [Closterium sp. NIES-68]GJP60416.1 hypothetical protein CLOP_g17639 [Closterium sp. NIES-67]GJP76823.1 hypothetical protein CLOP_g7277 [Closterium sp. NIES-67]
MQLAWTPAAKSAKKRMRRAKGGEAVLRAFGDQDDVAAASSRGDLAVADEARGEDATWISGETEPRRKTRVEETAQLQQRGNAFAQAGDFPAALATWDAAIGLCPLPRQRAVLFEQKAQVLMEMGRLWEAVRAGTCATEIAPEWHDAWVTLARAQLNFGEPQLAQASFSHALLLQPGNAEAQQELREASRLAVRQRQLAAAAAGGDAEMVTRVEVGMVRGVHGDGVQQQAQQQEQEGQQEEQERQGRNFERGPDVRIHVRGNMDAGGASADGHDAVAARDALTSVVGAAGRGEEHTEIHRVELR